MWVEFPHRERQQSAKSWGYGGKAPVAGHHPALSAHCTAGILSLSIATRPDRAAAPKAPSTFGGGAPSYNALKTEYSYSVTAEAAGSSPVDPAILLNGLQTYPLHDQGILGDDNSKPRLPSREFASYLPSLDQLWRGQQAR